MISSEQFPEAWSYFLDQARNVENTDVEYLGKYRIPNPTIPIESFTEENGFIYAEKPEILFRKLVNIFYKIDFNSPSVYGKIQYIVNNF